MAKNDNMLAILWMLNSGRKMTAKQISEKLEIHIRTVYRYIDALSASGVPILSDAGHNGGYSLLNHFIKAPLLFETEEKKALLQAAAFAKEAGYPLSEALDHATAKLKMYSNQEQERLLNHHLAGLEVINSRGTLALQPLLMALEQAVETELSLDIEYRTGRDAQGKQRRIDPYGMVYWNHKWYTVAFCHLRNEIRSFRVDRLLHLQPTENKFKRPEGFSAREFFMQRLLPDLAGKDGLTALMIEGRSEALDDLCLHWFLGHHLKERTPNGALFMLDETALQRYVPYFLLTYGKSIQIMEPQSLKERMVEITSDLKTYYEL